MAKTRFATLPYSFFILLQTKIQPDDIDTIISAEIPNKDRDPILYEIVCKNMIHGPCGELNIRSPCMNNGKCSKKYPRKLVKDTQTGDDGIRLTDGDQQMMEVILQY